MIELCSALGHSGSKEYNRNERASRGDCHADAGKATLARQVLSSSRGNIVTQIPSNGFS
jgi:hypothetical protein